MDESEYLGRVRELSARAWPVDPPREPHYPIGRSSSPTICGIGRASRQTSQQSISTGTTRHSLSLTISPTALLTGGRRENMAVYKVPIVRIVDALPLTATGNVRKQDLAPLAEQL